MRKLVLCGVIGLSQVVWLWGAAPASLPPTAQWLLSGNTEGQGEHPLPAENQGVLFIRDEMRFQSEVAQFDGQGAHLRIPTSEALNPGAGDFSVTLWLDSNRQHDEPGDLISKYDSKTRTGFLLGLRTNSGQTSSQSNVRQLQFGIDQGSEPRFTDVGRPGQAVLGFSICVHAGELYVGTCEPGKGQSGRVYRWEAPDRWLDCGAPDTANSVSALAVHDGQLYAGTSKYRLAGSALAESENSATGGGIYRYAGDQKWIPCGQLPEREAIGGLCSFQGRLYVSSLYRPAGFFRYVDGQNWEALPVPNGKRVEALGVYNGALWATGYDEGHVYRFDGQSWTDLGPVGDNTQTYSFAVHQGQLCVGTWPSGKVYRLTAEQTWEDYGRLGVETEVMAMLVHNGQYYAGSLPLAQVFRLDADRQWTLLKQLDETPDVKYRRVWTAAQFRGQVFWTTLPTGHIHAMEVGKMVTYDHELPDGWRHIGAVRDGGRLKLFVDGKQVAESTEFDPSTLNLSSMAPLQIGAGPGDYFQGRLRDVRFYRRALTAAEMHSLMTP